jgi:ribosomal protein S18 acetylase RimI-like enzyme
MHSLDNVIWRALTTRQAGFAEIFQDARRFVREVTSLCAFAEANARGYESLGNLVGNGGTAALFLESAYEPIGGWDVIGGGRLLQMVWNNGVNLPISKNGASQIIDLGRADSAEMVELATLTKPGPFGSRTHELGSYVGIRSEGKLVAMAGERLKVPGFTEVSAVCTHPGHTGRGYAQLLMTEIMRRICERGETPFLHVRCANARAVQIYERLGYRTRVEWNFVVLRRTL